MKKAPIGIVVILLGISLLGLFLRLYRIEAPLADWHSWRQADTAAVARNFQAYGVDLLRPRYDDLSNIQSGKDNPSGWRMVEFPVYQATAVWLSRVNPEIPIEIWLRLVSIAASVGTVVLLGLIAGPLPAFVFTVLPFSIYYGRSILPEPFAMFWAILSVYVVRKNLLLSALAGAIALLVKPTAVFLLLPIVYVLRKNVIGLFVYWFIGLLPLLVWRKWILNFPEGIPVNMWLLNGNGIRFKGAWFYWLFAKRLGELMLGYWGLVPFALGISPLWGIGALLYLIIFATGNVQHDYYQIFILPAVCMFVGKGLAKMRPLLALVSFIFMIAFSWYTVRTYYWINRPEIVEAGIAADKLLPKDAKVIASYNGDTTFLYQTRRQGWPLGFDIDQKIAMGATHYVTVSPGEDDGETNALASEYTVLVRNDKYAIIDLTKPQVR